MESVINRNHNNGCHGYQPSNEITNMAATTTTQPLKIDMLPTIFLEDIYKARHAHKRLYTGLPKYSKIQVLPGITSCRLMKYNKQAIELNDLLKK